MPRNIVYLDDEVDLLENFSMLISSESWKVHTFSEPKSALDFIRNQMPDLVILDYRLPSMTGDEVALLISPNIPKILVSGELDLNLKSHFLKIFRKPLRFSEFEKYLHEHFQKQN